MGALFKIILIPLKRILPIFINKSCTKSNYYLKILYLIFSLPLFTLSIGCKNEKAGSANQTSPLAFKVIDSVYLSGNMEETNRLLDIAKKNISKENVENLTYYYYYKGLTSYRDTMLMNKYADGALNLYQDIALQKKYPNAYIKALMLKSEVYVIFKKYDEALEAFFKIRSLLNKDENPTFYADYISKIAQLYYEQRRFKQAARYHLDVFRILEKVKETPATAQNIFYLKQGALNNAGFCYERAEILDSAIFYYQKGLEYIKEEKEKKQISPKQLEYSSLVLLDNLGGITAKKGNFSLAKKYLEESVAADNHKVDRSKSTAYLKLADVYIHLKQFDKADTILNLAKIAIKEYSIDRYELTPRLYKVKSNLNLAKKDYKQAYFYLAEHNRTIDSIRNSVDELSKTDLALKFESMQNKQDLQTLAKTNQSKTIYLVCASIFILMLIPIGFLINKNIKQGKIVEKKTFEHNKQLEKAMLTLENRNKDYAKIMKVMAHDLKNPISGIVGIASLLLQEEDKFTSENREMFKLIENSGENSIEMINQLLNSGLSVENEILKKESIDIQQLLRQCTELLQYKADEKKQKIIFISGGPFIISISREKIWRVINNLIVNAIKFSPPKTEVIVILERLAKGIRIKVVDQGIGIPDTDKEKIFEMFTSAKRTGTAGEQPFGIGLSTSRQIIEGHKGKIWLEDNPDGGTVFYVELPLH